ncbi:hypothetical protein [Bacillus atrophaeus]|uniref:hypothetical protein n=1 Tax=Bacillus atrophaeus TaxID=1452 RepID=UPI002DBBE371|nr:hypothetical protein [Bacillus atrophaeus]MEC1900091.1 hypothetical protein [Bacillus atrophaeus]MEC2397083.1 hypothetical protein [Bacillus atrophaeus]MED4436068.1 hypothetical protein [Bacillus atrophaeus]MED4565574.1 hypothetical protein [Bacillus atrophaeus]MED4575567.1 hypothetical protein [Bacillus atrophaeus]
MNKKNNILTIAESLNKRLQQEPLRVLSEEDWAFWKENGYVVIHDAVPKDYIERTANLIWEFEEKDPENPSDCTRQPAVRFK